MFKKIIIATDLSEASDRLCDCAGSLKHVGPEKIWLIHVCNVRDVGGLSGDLKQQHIAEIAKETAILKKHGLTVKPEIVEGIPFVEINREATKKKASLIVVGRTAKAF